MLDDGKTPPLAEKSDQPKKISPWEGIINAIGLNDSKAYLTAKDESTIYTYSENNNPGGPSTRLYTIRNLAWNQLGVDSDKSLTIQGKEISELLGSIFDFINDNIGPENRHEFTVVACPIVDIEDRPLTQGDKFAIKVQAANLAKTSLAEDPRASGTARGKTILMFDRDMYTALGTECIMKLRAHSIYLAPIDADHKDTLNVGLFDNK